MESANFNEASEKFLQWFKSLPGAQFSDAIKIVDLRDRKAGRGIIALEEIAPETVLFTIPRKGIINVETSELPKKIPDVFDLDAQGDDENDNTPQMDSWSSLILVMIFEYLLGDKSTWKPYFDVLPSTFNTPMFWSEEELEHLQSSHMRSKVGKASAEEMFRTRLLPIIRKHSNLFATSEARSDEDLIEIAHRMGSTIMAYAFDLENDEQQDEEDEADGWVEDRDGKSMLGMVPMADILNADAEFNAHVNHEEDSLTVTALRTIKAGEEILNYYGPHPNSELLRRYGYVSEKHSRYDVVEIPWEVVESVLASDFDVPRKFLEKIREQTDEDEFEDTFVLERETSEVNSDGTFAGPATFTSMPEDLHEQLKTVLKAVKKLQPEAIPDKRKRDEMHHAVLVKTLERLISQYPTKIMEDELLLKKEELGSRRRMAIEVRLGEKKLLQEALSAISGGEDTEMGDGDDAPQKRTKLSG